MLLHKAVPEKAQEFAGYPLELVVLHTTTQGTLHALRTAADLAQGLGARIRLLVLQAVPYALPLTEPNVSLEFTQRRFRTLAAGSGVDTYVDIRLGRDRETMLKSAVERDSVVVVGKLRKHLWFSKENRLVKQLKRMGYQVVVSTEGDKTAA